MHTPLAVTTHPGRPLTWPTRWGAWALLLALTGVAVAEPCRGEEQPASVPAAVIQPADAGPIDGDVAQPPADPEVDPLVVPAGDAAEMIAYIRRADAAARAATGSVSEKLRFQMRASTAILAAADQGLAAEPTDDETVKLTTQRLTALSRLKMLVDFETQMVTVGARRDDRPAVATLGWRGFVTDGLEKWPRWSAGLKERWRTTLLAELPTDNEEMAEVRSQALRRAAVYMSRTDVEAAQQLAADAIEALRDLPFDNEKIAGRIVDLEGMLRRLDLPGNKMEITGTLIDGAPLDWESYRGKVVLVDYWATWCGPCRAELPNVKEMYAGYHDKGFDVVGISLDTSQEKTEQFLLDQEIPWATLYGEDEEHDGWDHPMATHYGISGIPTAILVDQQGVVVSLSARGAELRDQLAKLLGEPIEPPAEEAAADQADQAAATAGDDSDA